MLNKAIQSMEKVIYPLNAAAQRIAMIVLFLMMMLTVFDVTGRAMSRPPLGAFELTGFGLAILIFYSLGFTQIHKGHIVVSFLVDKWPRRVQAVVDIVIYSIFFALVSLTTWQVAQHAIRLFNGNDKTADLGIKIYIVAIIACVGIFLFALSLLLDLMKAINEAVTKDEC